MRREPPSPDDRESILPESLQQVEATLRHWKPPAVAWDVEAIRRAALAPDLGLENGQHEEEPAREKSSAVRRGAWLRLGATWVGGAVAGSLLTAAFMSRSAEPVSTLGQEHGNNATAEVVAPEAKPPRPSDPGNQPRQTIEDSDEVPQWSATDYRIANQLSNSSLPAIGETTMRAACFIQISAASRDSGGSEVNMARGAIPFEDFTPPATAGGAEALKDLPSQREKLLRELLEHGAESTL